MCVLHVLNAYLADAVRGRPHYAFGSFLQLATLYRVDLYIMSFLETVIGRPHSTSVQFIQVAALSRSYLRDVYLMETVGGTPHYVDVYPVEVVTITPPTDVFGI